METFDVQCSIIKIISRRIAEDVATKFELKSMTKNRFKVAGNFS